MSFPAQTISNLGDFFGLYEKLQEEKRDFDLGPLATEMDISIEPYGALYELPVGKIAVYLFCELGMWESLVSAAQSENPQAAVIKLVDDDAPNVEFSLSLMQRILGSFVVVERNLESVRSFDCWMPELLSRVEHGDDDALFQAVLVDTTVLETYVARKRISEASVANDRRFFDRLAKPITRTKPTRPVPRLDNTRLAMEVIDEAGLLQGMTDSELTDLITYLNLYPIDGDALQAIRRQRQKRDTARNHLNRDLGDSHVEPEMP